MILLRDALWLLAEGVVVFFIAYFFARFVTERKEKKREG